MTDTATAEGANTGIEDGQSGTDQLAPSEPGATASAKKAGPKKKTAGARGGGREHNSRPVVFYELTLKTMHAQRAFQRCYKRLTLDLYTIDVIMRQLGATNHIAEAEAYIGTLFEKNAQDMKAELERLQHLLDENADVLLGGLAENTAPKQYKAEINTPLARRFLADLEMVDQLIVHIDTAWLNDLIDSRRRNERTNVWQQRMIRTANRVRGVADGLRQRRNQDGTPGEPNEQGGNTEGDTAAPNEAASAAEPAPAPSRAKSTKSKAATA